MWTIGLWFSATASKSAQVYEQVLAETMKDNAARISARMKKHCAGTIGPPDFACIAYSFLHAGAQIDDDLQNNSEEEANVYDVDMDEYVPSSSGATKNKLTPAIYTVNFLCWFEMHLYYAILL